MDGDLLREIRYEICSLLICICLLLAIAIYCISTAKPNTEITLTPPLSSRRVESASIETDNAVTVQPIKTQEDEWIEMQVIATAYTAGPESTGKYPGHPAYGITKSGTRAREGRTIAVDPKVIPLGSQIKIPKLSPYTYIAEDIGGKIKGNRIDIYMENLEDAIQWGVRPLKILVKKPH